MSAETGATITPRPEARCCEADGCGATDRLALVEPDADADRRVLCPDHRVDYLREVYLR